MRVSALLLIVIAAISLAACGPGNKAGTGTVAGALAGGLIGNQFGKGSGRVAATAVGAVAGGMIGNGIGAQMDAEDRRRAAEAQYQALEYGRPVSWNNPQSQYSGQVAVGNPYQQNGNNCRSYTNTIYIDGRPEVSRGVACRQPDGTWRTVS